MMATSLIQSICFGLANSCALNYAVVCSIQHEKVWCNMAQQSSQKCMCVKFHDLWGHWPIAIFGARIFRSLKHVDWIKNGATPQPKYIHKSRKIFFRKLSIRYGCGQNSYIGWGTTINVVIVVFLVVFHYFSWARWLEILISNLFYVCTNNGRAKCAEDHKSTPSLSGRWNSPWMEQVSQYDWRMAQMFQSAKQAANVRWVILPFLEP